MKNLLVMAVAAVGLPAVSLRAGDVVFADFEGGRYPDGWKVEGACFGAAPATGTLPAQQVVSGFRGRGFVNTYLKGDRSTGKLTSPEFTVEKKAINFLIGGGCHPGKCCLNLVVDGQVVRSATGSDRESLAEDGWDVAELVGKRAHLEIVDSIGGGWGHVNVDDIVFSDESRARAVVEVVHTIAAETPFLLVPVSNTGAMRDRFEIYDGETCIRFWTLAWGAKKADWHAPLDLSAWTGRKLAFRIVNMTAAEGKKALAQLRFAAKPELPADVHDEPQRAQLHLTPTLGWTNDPNGLSYYKGEYHVFYQHNPCNRNWQNMTWGHFVSKDLVHWTDVGDAIHPDALGPMFSGSAVFDPEGTAGFGRNAHVLVYTAAGNPAVQCIAGSADGRHYEKLAANPVIANITGGNRDPRAFWHAASKQWVLCLYVGGFEKDGVKWHTVHIFNSPDLKNWKLADVVYGHKDHKSFDMTKETNKNNPQIGTYLYECPDLVELKVAGTDETRWVIWGASGEYGVGTFDGSKFVAEEKDVKATWNLQTTGWRTIYAAQTFTGDPKGRTVWLPWMKLKTDDNVNFNQGFGIPMALSLKRTTEGLRMVFDPVEEYATLRDGAAVPFAAFEGELAEAFFEAKVGPDAVVTLDLRGEKLVYDATKGTLSLQSSTLKRPAATYRWQAPDGRLALRLFVDRFGLEVLSADGLQLAPFGDFWPSARNRTLHYTASGRVNDVKTKAYRLKSMWGGKVER